jgi:hypothetical protein
VDIDLTGFAGDCIIGGRFQLRSGRLTDELNRATSITLTDVVLDGLDGHRVTAPTFTIERSAGDRCGSQPTGAVSRLRSGPTWCSVAITGRWAPRRCARSPSGIRWSR